MLNLNAPTLAPSECISAESGVRITRCPSPSVFGPRILSRATLATVSAYPADAYPYRRAARAFAADKRRVALALRVDTAIAACLIRRGVTS